MNSVNYKNNKLAHDAHSVGINEMHLQWCTKYRYETLRKESYYVDCENAIRSAAKRHGIKIIELGVMPDHVHAVAILPPTMCPSKAIGLLKGASSYELFRLHPNFKKTYFGGHFWSRGYFYRSVSGVTEEVIRKYVRDDNTQRQKLLCDT
jgi:putative transposase